MSDAGTFTDKEGKTISIAEYIRKQEEKEAGKKSTKYSEESGQYVPSLRKRAKLHVPYLEPKGKQRYSNTRLLSPGRVGKEVKMPKPRMSSSAIDMRQSLLIGVMKHQGEWVNRHRIIQSATGLDFSEKKVKYRFQGPLTNVLKYLEKEDIVESKPNPAGRGNIYLFKAQVDNIPENARGMLPTFLTWEKKHMREVRAKAKNGNGRKSTPEPEQQEFDFTEKEETTEPEAPAPSININTPPELHMVVDVHFHFHLN